MNAMNRHLLLISRVFKALKMGLIFSGTRNFKLPKSFLANGQRINLNAPSEKGLAWDFINVLLDDEYGLSSVSPSPKTVLDIGANIGLFSLWARYCFPAATIHAYEPNPRITPFISQNLAPVDVTFFAEGIGSQSGFASGIDQSESRLGQFTVGATAGIKVISLQEAVDRLGGNIDLLKLDCEGAEWEIFRDPQPFANIKSVRMEYHLTGDRTITDVKQIVEGLDYVIDRLEENTGFGIIWFSRP